MQHAAESAPFQGEMIRLAGLERTQEWSEFSLQSGAYGHINEWVIKELR
jgi:hypothetical protein